jgi:hypothetical protein
MAEGVGIIEWHGDRLEVRIHPGRQPSFVDRRFSAGAGQS